MPSDSFERGGQPRSVPDPDRETYDRMIREHRAMVARQDTPPAHDQGEVVEREKLLGDRLFGEAQSSERGFPDVGHPSVAESMIPIWGSGREALADLHDGNYAGAAFDGTMAASDLFLAKAAVGGLAKGGLKIGGSYVWRNAPWEEESARQWLARKGFLKPGQPGHHWLLEQRGSAPDWIRNQPPFIKGTADAVEHGRIHGPYTTPDGVRLPQFNAAQRYWYGTPDWWKALNASASAHAGLAADRSLNNEARQAQ